MGTYCNCYAHLKYLLHHSQSQNHMSSLVEYIFHSLCKKIELNCRSHYDIFEMASHQFGQHSLFHRHRPNGLKYND